MAKKILMPEEVKQKEVVWLHFYGRPITSRMLLFFFPSLIVSIVLLAVVFKLQPVEKSGLDKFAIITKRFMTVMALPAVAVAMSTMKRNGKYIGEVIGDKFKYKKSAKIVFCKKASKAISKQEVKLKPKKQGVRK